MRSEENTIDFQPNYLVPLTKFKTSELKALWKDDVSFRKYVRKFWILSQKSLIETMVSKLEDAGAELDYDLTGVVPGLDGVIYFKVIRSVASIDGFVNGIESLKKEYGLFTLESTISQKIFGSIDEDDEETNDAMSKIVFRKPPQVIVFAELKKAWNAFKKNKKSQFEPMLFTAVEEQLDKAEHLFTSFICVAFDWIMDDARMIELLGDFVDQFKDRLYYDMMNKRFMEVGDISKLEI